MQKHVQIKSRVRCKTNKLILRGNLLIAQKPSENATKRFELGVVNTLELNTSRNLRDRAELDLLNAKYQYIFNMKVLDFYMGRGLTLN